MPSGGFIPVSVAANAGLLSPGHSFSVLTQRHMHLYGTKREHFAEIVDTLRTLLGGIPLLMPASIDVMTDEGLRDTFERWWKTPSIEA